MEIHAVFMDLATMVSARGDELNRMEDHVNALIIKTEKTAEKIEEVEVKRKKRRKKFILVALLALLLIFIVIGASSGGGYASRDCKVDPALLDPRECHCDHFICGD